MKKTIPIGLGILWLIIVAFLAFSDGADWSHKESLNLCQDGLQTGSSFYIMDNREKESVVYHIDEQHQVVDMFRSNNYKEGITFSGLSFKEYLYVLVKEKEGAYRIY